MGIEKMKYVNFVGGKEYLDDFINKYMTEDSPKLFKEELNDAINEVFDIIKKKIENKN